MTRVLRHVPMLEEISARVKQYIRKIFSRCANMNRTRQLPPAFPQTSLPAMVTRPCPSAEFA